MTGRLPLCWIQMIYDVNFYDVTSSDMTFKTGLTIRKSVLLRIVSDQCQTPYDFCPQYTLERGLSENRFIRRLFEVFNNSKVSYNVKSYRHIRLRRAWQNLMSGRRIWSFPIFY